MNDGAIEGVIGMANGMAKKIRELSNLNQRQRDELRSAQESAETLLLGIVDLFLPHLGGHSRRVAALVDEVGKRMGISENARKVNHSAAIFHEIGMLGIRREALFAPWSHLSDTERNLILAHPNMGAALLKPMSWYQDAAVLVSAHHERWDGSGFPRHLVGENIPLGARIIAVCDVYDEMLNKPKDAPQTFSEDEVLAHIQRQRGGYFDPKIVDLILEPGIRGPGTGAASLLATEISLSVRQLRPGMMLARDLYNTSGLIMLTKDTILQEAVIIRLQGLQDGRAVVEPIFVRVDANAGGDSGKRA
ncbi:response regulator receiver modulated metal dependent phosphohydrolase [Burkholderiales bacterium GJ-E10]|nr:response regulator receiver modulated metal dependent phosphohydrolase [Burkholderiales bacterium GJ-E10]